MNTKRMLGCALSAWALAVGSANAALEVGADAIASLAGQDTNGSRMLGFTGGLPLGGAAQGPSFEEAVGFWWWAGAAASDVDTGSDVVPTITAFAQVGPNPFSLLTTLRFQLALDGSTAVTTRARLEIFDVNGRNISSLVHGDFVPGFYDVVWDRQDRFGRDVPSGVYFARFETAGYAKTIRLVATE